MANTKKIPKRIAGVKLPKPLRRGLRDLAASKKGRAVLAEALNAAGAALDAGQARSSAPPPKEAAKAPAKSSAPIKGSAPAKDAGGRPDEAARAATVAALEDAARSFTDTLRRRSATEAPPPPQPTAPSSASTH